MKIALRELTLGDMEPIRNWRNEQIQFLRQSKPLNEEDQLRYWQEVLVQEQKKDQPRLHLFAIRAAEELVGYGGLTNISWEHNRAEISFLAATKFTKDTQKYSFLFEAFLKEIQAKAFEKIGLNRLFTETYDLRPWHVKCLERSGFVYEGTLRGHTRSNGSYVDSLLHGFCSEDYKASRLGKE